MVTDYLRVKEECMSLVTVWEKSKAWVSLSRPQFHSVGVLPLALGSVLAWRSEGVFPWALWGWANLGAILIMLSAYWAGECFDYEEDRISGERGRSRFAGGTGVIHSGIVSRQTSFVGSIAALMLAGVVGLIIWLGYGTGPWTIPLGILGMIGGFLAQGLPALEAAKLGVYLHGLAGDLAAHQKGERGLAATDLIEETPKVLRALASGEGRIGDFSF